MSIPMQVNFTPGERQNRETQDDLDAVARYIAGLPGFLWRIWIENKATSIRGGIYLFDDLASARAFGDDELGPRLAEDGATDISIRCFEIDERASAIDFAPLGRFVPAHADL